ncbi:MAG: 23S rRNA (adenine(2503)-C(2))-methyltransferase RlmN [Deltaproteobacteria bacterium]|nr:23S rRNA (adenine(2503)-C(2))-methyltransferase RlmN [Deltaproteobacteria bacterium]
MKNLRNYTYADLLPVMAEMGEKPFRAAQVYAWVFQRGASGIDFMTDISKGFRERLKQEFCIAGPEVNDVRTSTDGTRKFLTLLEDGNKMESVLIPSTDGRLTLCVSTQAGCALGCRFCLTGANTFTRNLTLAELSGQVLSARGLINVAQGFSPENLRPKGLSCNDGEHITNIVLMGMGEPLTNYENVIKFLGVLVDGKGFGFSHNKVTVSTAGLAPGIRRLAAESRVNLAVSLNATTDEIRDRIMPINKKYPIEELLSAVKDYCRIVKKTVTVEYVLLKNVNDSNEDARRLAGLLKGVPCKVNLIPFNEFPGCAFQRPDELRVIVFHKILLDEGYTVLVRASKGGDILAACGQLSGAA